MNLNRSKFKKRSQKASDFKFKQSVGSLIENFGKFDALMEIDDRMYVESVV